MTNMKKILSVTAAAAMLLGVSACGSNNNNGGTAAKGTQSIKLTVWGPSEDQAKSDSWLPTMEKQFAKAHPEYKITWKNAVVSEGDAGKTVKQDPSAAADVYMFANDQLGTLIDAQAIGEVSDDAKAQIKKQDDDAIIKSVTGTDGKIYGVPFTGNTYFMYYNKSKFSSDDIKSLDTMLQKGKVSYNLGNSWYLPAFYTGAGMTLFGKDAATAKDGIKMDSAAATDVTKYLVDLVKNPNFVVDNDEGAGLAALQNGTVDAIFSGTWSASDVKKALGNNYAAAQLPSFTTSGGSTYQMKAFYGSKAVGYNPNSKVPQAAAEFATYLGSSEAQKAHYTMRQIVPTDKSLASTYKNDPAAVAQNDTIANTSTLQPTIAQMGNFWDPCKNFGTAIVNGDVNSGNAQAKAQAWLDSYKNIAKDSSK
ncbi:extracellular solute-binding protein [Bifidobacterium boum]|uniref:extracellular solute-binding protein n=1 Tax=Bifidobacterium boum TaxID=78343 RepID=UPI001F3CE025|nr:extracellular solute-binding protein [Bifidobacterium boum]MCF2562283.1 extracellular solute-binding protein [Bifidobacterium boum]MCI5860859.1 extracellular solute-binding protein [Bifidobacterium boum]MDD6087345.1 extracellular solute-binding protein [Bifidobacterium boum]